MQEASDISTVPMNADEFTEFKNPIPTAVTCSDENIPVSEDLVCKKAEVAKLNGFPPENICWLENTILEKEEGTDPSSITSENIPVLENARPGEEEETVINSITAEKLEQLMTEVEQLKAEQLKFQNEQEQYNQI